MGHTDGVIGNQVQFIKVEKVKVNPKGRKCAMNDMA